MTSTVVILRIGTADISPNVVVIASSFVNLVRPESDESAVESLRSPWNAFPTYHEQLTTDNR